MKSTKRLLCLLLCTVMVLSQLTACGGQGEESQPTLNTTDTTTAPTAVPTTIPETTVPETTVTETTVPEPTIPPFVVDGAFAYSKEEFITMLEQRLVNTDCPACLEYNYEKLSSSDNRLLVYYNILSDGNSREYVASLDLWMNAQSGEIQVIRIVFGSEDPAQVPLIRQFANACVSIIDPTMQTDIYATVSDKGTFAVYDILNYYGTIHNEVAYILKTMNQSDGDSMFAPCDLLIQTKAFLEEDDPGFYKILAEWLESV